MIMVLIIIILGWIGTLLILQDWDAGERGTFGDMFGSINALYSGLALAGIIYTIIIQRSEIKLQSKKIEETNKEIKRQRFDASLFSLLSLHQEIVRDLYVTDSAGEAFKGRNAFRYFYKKAILEEGTGQIEDDLGHYFRNIYRIVKFIDKFEFSEKDIKENNEVKYQNVKFLRSQLSSKELILMYYWGLSDEGERLRPFIEKYSLLLHIPKSFKEKSVQSGGYDNQAFIIKKEYQKNIKD